MQLLGGGTLMMFSLLGHMAIKEQLVEFLEELNQFHPFIKFMVEWSSKFVLFLEMKATVGNEGCLTTNQYVKSADTHQYLH